MKRYTIVTHNGVFHADDVFAVATILVATAVHPDSAEDAIVRTRDPSIVAGGEGVVVVDVGGVHDPSRRRYDHHQKGRAGGRPNGVLYSSFGLVWAAFKEELNLREEVWEEVDRTLVQPIDATDNGQQLYEGGKAIFENVQGYSLSAAVSSFNPSATFIENSHPSNREEIFKLRFLDAVTFAYKLLLREIESAWELVNARSEVREAIEASRGGPVVVLHRFRPWGEQVRDESPTARYCVFPSETGTWMVQGVNATPGTFDLRRPLPEAWAGLRDEAFQAATGVKDGVFCHPGRFICGAGSREGALRLAELALG